IEIRRLTADSPAARLGRLLHARCPRCGRLGSLSLNERRQKRSYCAACEADFDITADALVSDVVAPRGPEVIATIDATPNCRIIELAIGPDRTKFRIEHVLPERFKNPTAVGGAFLFLGMFIVPAI